MNQNQNKLFELSLGIGTLNGGAGSGGIAVFFFHLNIFYENMHAHKRTFGHEKSIWFRMRYRICNDDEVITR